MGDWPILLDGQRIESIGVDGANSRGTGLVAPASTNTKGSYVQLTASTSFAAGMMMIRMGDTTVPPEEMLVDIAVGGSGSEQVIIENLLLSHGGEEFTWLYQFPVRIPAGSRVAARAQASSADARTRISAQLIAGGFLGSAPYGGVVTLGANTADSGGTQIDPGGTANTKGSYSELMASTDKDIFALSLANGGQGNTARTFGNYLLDIAVGGSGSEQVIIPDLHLLASNVGDGIYPIITPLIPCYIPAGSRVAARASCDFTNATDRLFDLIAYGVN